MTPLSDHLDALQRMAQDLSPEEAEEALGALETIRTRLWRRAMGINLKAGPPLMTAAEVALRLNMHRNDVYHLIESGALRAMKTGKARVRIESAEVDRYLSIRRARGA